MATKKSSKGSKPKVDKSASVLEDLELTSLNTGRPLQLASKTITKLGEGTYGAVYLATLEGQGEVAIKVQSNLQEETEKGSRGRWVNVAKDQGIQPAALLEATILVKLHHPNVVSLIDTLLSSRNLAVVLPRARESLHDYVKRKWAESVPGIPDEDAKYISLQMARGIAYIQSLDILNGDYKTANVLIYEEPDCSLRAVITDFGLASLGRCYEPADPNVYFTIWWRPPELLLNGTYTFAADSWALGCMVAELLIGRSPFIGGSEAGMLFEIAAKLGVPSEAEWPGMSTLSYRGTGLVATIQGQNTSKPPYELHPAKNYNDPEGQIARFAYNNPKAKAGEAQRVVLSEEKQAMLRRLLQWDPKRRVSVVEYAERDVWLTTARARIANQACQEAEEIRVVGCTVALSGRMGYEVNDVTSRGHKSILYSWMCTVSHDVRASDRILVFSLYLLERYRTLRNDITTPTYQKFALACFKIAGDLIERGLSTLEELSVLTNSTVSVGALAEAEREVIRATGVDISVATIYDVAREYSLSYSTLIQQAVRSFVLLAYFASVTNERDAELVGICCVMLACQTVGETFKHADGINERFGRDSVMDVVVAFGKGLQECFQAISEKTRKDIFVVVQRGNIDTKSLLRSTKVLSLFISPEYIRDDKADKASVNKLVEGLSKLSVKV